MEGAGGTWGWQPDLHPSPGEQLGPLWRDRVVPENKAPPFRKWVRLTYPIPWRRDHRDEWQLPNAPLCFTSCIFHAS